MEEPFVETGSDLQSDEEDREAYGERGPIPDPAGLSTEVLRELAAIPEASTPSRKSKRRATSVEEHLLNRAERMKAARNLDFNVEYYSRTKKHLPHPKLVRQQGVKQKERVQDERNILE
jgi:hypothetical protein